MEVSDPSGAPASQELSNKSEPVMTPDIQHQYCAEDLSIDDLKMRLDEFLNDLKMCLDEFMSTEDIGLSTTRLRAGNNNKCDVVMEDECHSDESNDNLPQSTCSIEELLFREQGRDDDNKTAEASGRDKSVYQGYSLPNSSATPLKPSAMKGSREKQGLSPKKLSVTWAPDVFDPIPTSVSHAPSSKNQQYRNNGRKYGKNKQRGGGKSSRGGKGKDKKQARKLTSN